MSYGCELWMEVINRISNQPQKTVAKLTDGLNHWITHHEILCGLLAGYNVKIKILRV